MSTEKTSNWKLIKAKTFSKNKITPSENNNNTNEKSTKTKPVKVKEKFSLKKWMSTRLKEFCSVTALHGYGHIIREDTALWERVVWALIAFSALIAAITLLWFSWMWNAETPTVTVIESTHYATWNIPFPAVTVCNSNKISASAALTKATSMIRPEKMTPEELSAKFRLILHFEGTGEAPDADYEELHNILRTNNLDIDSLMKSISPTCENMLERCNWKGTQTRCDTLFQLIKTTEGYCCSFNYYGTLKNNYPPKIIHSIPKTPRRVTACGYETGLSILLKPNIQNYHSTALSTYGFRVMIHDSYDFADDNAETKLVASNLEAFISLSPESTYSTKDVYNLPESERNCLASNERRMNVMQRYSYINCLAECRSDIVIKACGCIPYSLPNNGSHPVCDMSQLRCVKTYREYFEGSLPGVNKTVASLSDVEKSPCGCYPDCELQQYPSEISLAELNRRYSFNSIGFFKDITLQEQTLLHVFFKDLVSTHYRNDMYQNWLGVLASFGGLLGLFLGFSLITGFELIYFFTLRVIFDRFTKKKVVSKK